MAFLADISKHAKKINKQVVKQEVDEMLEREKKTKVPDIHLPIKQFELQDYNQILNISINNITDDDKQDNDENTTDIKKIHIVHISDTHMRHKDFSNDNRNIIPFKKDHINILIHSGDFSQRAKLSNNKIPEQIHDFNKWFMNEPHQKKVIIAGNHEMVLNHFTKQEIKEKIFECNNITYLQDDSINLYGIEIYGTPWTSSRKMGFSANQKELKQIWKLIPNNIDILVTHLPPLGIMDTAYSKKYNNNKRCKVCNHIHLNGSHWGNYDLLNEITNRIKPKVNLFGHVHQGNGYHVYKDIIFVNSAMDLIHIPHQFDVIFDL